VIFGTESDFMNLPVAIAETDAEEDEVAKWRKELESRKEAEKKPKP
jgi:hypothetical protein